MSKMKMAHVAIGNALNTHLETAGYTYHVDCKVWFKIWNMDAGPEGEHLWLKILGLTNFDVDYDAVRPGNQKWLQKEIVEFFTKGKS